MKIDAKKICYYLALALLPALIVKIMIVDVPWQSTFSTIIFCILLEFVLLELEKDTATKRFGAKLWKLTIGIIVYFGVRIFVGYMFNMPLGSAHQELEGVGALGMTVQNLRFGTQSLILEAMFIPAGLGIAYLFVKGGKKTQGVVYVMAVLSFILVLYQVKQANHAEAVKRQAQATVDNDARNRNTNAAKKEATAATGWAVAKTDIPVVYEKKVEGKQTSFSEIAGLSLGSGDLVKLGHPDEKMPIYDNQALVEVVLVKSNGSYFGGKRVWVEAYMLDYTNGDEAHPKKYSTIKSNDGKLLTIIFNTDKKIRIDEIPIGQKYIISGAPQKLLKWPSVKNSKETFNFPQGLEIINKTGLTLQAPIGTVITIALT